MSTPPAAAIIIAAQERGTIASSMYEGYRQDRRDGLRKWARAITRDVHALCLAARDPRVPWYAKGVAVAVATYALSPIDLIPDFIPVLGYLDDAVIVPLGILLALRLIPRELMAEFRAAAARADGERLLGRRGAAAIVLLWIAGAIGAAAWAWSRF